jgi:chemotaxis protein methyltransferase CheR
VLEPDQPSDIEALEIRLMLEAINARYGYDLREYEPGSMRRRVQAALARTGVEHLGELQHRMLIDPIFFGSVLEQLTVQVTEMFRDPGFYRAFRTEVVPVLRTYPLLKVWHAGCSTGEEVYATAIVLGEEGLYDRTQIYATDVSRDAVEWGKRGIYGADQLPAFTRNYQDSGGSTDFSTHYTAAYDHVAMKESLRRNILFFTHNLVSDHVFGEMHVIFCRNVLMYFGPALRARVRGKLEGSLVSRGFLCLGRGERLGPPWSDRSFAELDSGERIYRRDP